MKKNNPTGDLSAIRESWQFPFYRPKSVLVSTRKPQPETVAGMINYRPSDRRQNSSMTGNILESQAVTITKKLLLRPSFC